MLVVVMLLVDKLLEVAAAAATAAAAAAGATADANVLSVTALVVTLFASRLLMSADGLVVVEEIVPDWFMIVVVPLPPVV
uniref:Putative secreted protein n=1 Tax=Anopheles darlingi TaxID=43151 RepID=A0A2M4DJ30_ANODA